jgi:hypothetical protein
VCHPFLERCDCVCESVCTHRTISGQGMHKELSIVPRTNLVGGGVEALLCLLKGRSLCRKAKGRNLGRGQNGKKAGWSPVWWSMPMIPATWEAEAGRSEFEASLGKCHKTLSQKQ